MHIITIKVAVESTAAPMAIPMIDTIENILVVATVGRLVVVIKISDSTATSGKPALLYSSPFSCKNKIPGLDKMSGKGTVHAHGIIL